MTGGEEREVVARTARALRRYRSWADGGGPRPRGGFPGASADEVLSEALPEVRTFSHPYFDLARAALRAAGAENRRPRPERSGPSPAVEYASRHGVASPL